MKKILLPLLLLFPISLSAQTPITGRVWEEDQENLQPLQYANVICYDAKWKAVTGTPSGEDGRFTLEPRHAGEYRLVVSMVGYTADTLKVDTRTGAVDVGDVKLRAGIMLSEMTVTAPLFTQLDDRFVYNVSADPDAKRMKMMEIMDKIPVLTIQPKDGRLAFMGSASLDIFIDGQRHEMINTGLQYPMRLIRGDVMNKIEIIPPGSPEYNNERPIVNIRTARALPNGFAAEYSGRVLTDNTWGPSLSVVSKVRDKVIFSLGYRFNYSDPPTLERYMERKTFIDDLLTDLQESKTEYGNRNRRHDISLRASAKMWGNPLRLGVRTTVGDQLSRSTLDRERYDGTGQLIDRQNLLTRNHSETKPRLNADASYFSKLPNSYRLTYDYSYTDDLRLSENISRTLGAADETLSGRRSESSTGYREHILRTRVGQFAKVDRHRVAVSMDYTQRQYDNFSDYTLWDALAGEWTTAILQNNGLAYTQRIAKPRASYLYNRKINSSTIFGSAGLGFAYENNRGEFMQNSGNTPLNYEKINLLPSISLTYIINKKYSVNGGYSMEMVRPQMNQLNPYINDTDPMNLVTGNPGLDPERSNNFNLGTTYQLVAGRRLISLKLLHSRIGNALERITEVDPASAIATTTWANIGNRNSLTAKLMFIGIVVRKWCDLSLWADYNYIEYLRPDKPANYVSGFSGNASFWVSPWPTGTFGVDYQLRSTTDIAQSSGVTYSHWFVFDYSQTIVKNKLYASVWINNPFESHRFLTTLTGDRNFSITTRDERRGQIIGFSIRGNFGRFRDKVGDAVNLSDDRARATIPDR